MLSKLQQVIKLLMIITRNGGNKSKHTHGQGGLLIIRYQSYRRVKYTVAAAGPWCFRMSEERINNESKARLSSSICFCDCPCEEDLQMFSKNFGSLHFVCSFQDDQDSQEKECDTETFLRRLSIVNAKVTIIFNVRDNELSHNKVFRAENILSVMDHTISMDSTIFGQSPFSVAYLPACTRMHAVLGEKLPLLLPSDAVEDELCGEVSMTCVATLGPCMDQYPNWPTRLSHIQVLVYSPSGIPLKRGEGHTQLSFLHSLADSLAWAELGLAGVCHAHPHSAQGPLSCEVVFSVDVEHSEDAQLWRTHAVSPDTEPEHTMEQVVTLFLLINYTDPFHSQLSDVIASEEILERCLDKVLWYNAEKVRLALQSLLKNTLSGFLKRKKSREKLQSAMSVIRSSVKTIVSSSTSVDFRTACLSSMKVQSSCDLSFLLHQKLQRVVNGRFVSGRKCTAKKALETAVCEQDRSEDLDDELPGKRPHGEMGKAPCGSKRQCSEFIGGQLDDFESNTWEVLDSQNIPPPCSQGSHKELVHISESSIQSTPELNKQQNDREWLQELEHLAEWD